MLDLAQLANPVRRNDHQKYSTINCPPLYISQSDRPNCQKTISYSDFLHMKYTNGPMLTPYAFSPYLLSKTRKIEKQESPRKLNHTL